jgi:indolepyruvate ferredoxin oxidoreductase alpha subunit
VRAGLRGEDAASSADTSLIPRPPVLCAGCPHRGVFATLRKLKAFVTGDIGCYTLGTLPPLNSLHTCLCMGAGIGEAHGIDKACGDPKQTVAVIGDSTFLHSGITGLLNIVYNNGSATVVILDNRTTAMTGGQDHPGTGRTLMGEPARAVDIEQLCRAVGVEHVQLVNPRDLKATESAIRAAMDHDGPSVVIARCACILISRDRQPAHAINEPECVQCGMCLRLGCPAISSIEREGERPQPVIDPALCTGCSLCVQVCPRNAITRA